MSRELSALKQQWGSAPASARRSREPVLRFTISVKPVKTRKNLWITTAQYRMRRAAEGHPIPDGYDVCHIIARSNGGANHVHNYIIERSRLNRSMGNRDDSVFARLAGLEQTTKAVAVSRKTGYMGPSAEELMDADY
jgi:hypothetical protein